MTRTYRLSLLLLALAVLAFAPASADSFRVFGEGGTPPGSCLYTWCSENATGADCNVSTPIVCNNPEGGASLRFTNNAWAGFGIFRSPTEPAPQPGNDDCRSERFDLSAFDGGEIRFFMRSPADLKVEFICTTGQPPADQAFTTFASQHGWDGTNTWQELSISICDRFPDACNPECLANIRSPFMATIEVADFNTFRVDHVRWETANTHSGASTVQVQGRQLLVDGEPFVVNGVAYSPLSIGENWQGAWRDRPDRYLVDFPLIAASGANAVRLYAPLLSKAMLDAAWANGLYVIPTFQPSAAQLGCPEGREFMKDRFREEILAWKDHPAILLWLIGNEFNVNLEGNDICTDWYPQLNALAQVSQDAEGAAAHPVSTANADTPGLGDVCQAGCSDDTALPNLDLWSVQSYRGCSFGTLFSDYQKNDCARPLLITEFGVDAWDGVLEIENQNLQASCLADLMEEADQGLAVRTAGGVSTGHVVFEWLDEWWKADPDGSVPDNTCVEGETDWATHDTCTSFNNFAYPDPAINEEWWGIVDQDPADPGARSLRSAHDSMAGSYRQGLVENLLIETYDRATGDTTVSFDPAAGSTDHTLYFGPLNSVSSYGYTGAADGLGGDGTGAATLPTAEALFWVVAGRDNAAEGCYGNDSEGAERPCFPDGAACALTQDANRSCQ